MRKLQTLLFEQQSEHDISKLKDSVTTKKEYDQLMEQIYNNIWTDLDEVIKHYLKKYDIELIINGVKYNPSRVLELNRISKRIDAMMQQLI